MKNFLSAFFLLLIPLVMAPSNTDATPLKASSVIYVIRGNDVSAILIVDADNAATFTADYTFTSPLQYAYHDAQEFLFEPIQTYYPPLKIGKPEKSKAKPYNFYCRSNLSA